jgi:hypothetical protein
VVEHGELACAVRGEYVEQAVGERHGQRFVGSAGVRGGRVEQRAVAAALVLVQFLPTRVSNRAGARGPHERAPAGARAREPARAGAQRSGRGRGGVAQGGRRIRHGPVVAAGAPAGAARAAAHRGPALAGAIPELVHVGAREPARHLARVHLVRRQAALPEHPRHPLRVALQRLARVPPVREAARGSEPRPILNLLNQTDGRAGRDRLGPGAPPRPELLLMPRLMCQFTKFPQNSSRRISLPILQLEVKKNIVDQSHLDSISFCSSRHE